MVSLIVTGQRQMLPDSAPTYPRNLMSAFAALGPNAVSPHSAPFVLLAGMLSNDAYGAVSRLTAFELHERDSCHQKADVDGSTEPEMGP